MRKVFVSLVAFSRCFYMRIGIAGQGQRCYEDHIRKGVANNETYRKNSASHGIEPQCLGCIPPDRRRHDEGGAGDQDECALRSRSFRRRGPLPQDPPRLWSGGHLRIPEGKDICRHHRKRSGLRGAPRRFQARCLALSGQRRFPTALFPVQIPRDHSQLV